MNSPEAADIHSFMDFNIEYPRPNDRHSAEEWEDRFPKGSRASLRRVPKVKDPERWGRLRRIPGLRKYVLGYAVSHMLDGGQDAPYVCLLLVNPRSAPVPTVLGRTEGSLF